VGRVRGVRIHPPIIRTTLKLTVLGAFNEHRKRSSGL
jgi:hypothetical protein